MPRKRHSSCEDEASRNFSTALSRLFAHPLFAPMMHRVHVVRSGDSACPPDGWVAVTDFGHLHVHPTRRAEPEEWIYVIAHALLHLGLNHFQPTKRAVEWNAACDVFVARFLSDLKIGRPPEELREADLPGGTEERLYQQFCTKEIPKHLCDLGTAGPTHLDIINDALDPAYYKASTDWQTLFAHGLKQAVAGAIEVAAGHATSLSQIQGSSAAIRFWEQWSPHLT